VPRRKDEQRKKGLALRSARGSKSGKSGPCPRDVEGHVRCRRPKKWIVVGPVPLLLQVNYGIRERRQVGTESASRLVFGVLGWKRSLDDVFTQFSQRSVINVTIYQLVSRCVTMRPANEIVGRRRHHCVEDRIIRVRNCAPQISLPRWTTPRRRHQPICLFEQVIGTKGRQPGSTPLPSCIGQSGGCPRISRAIVVSGQLKRL
jgi:hypothetical protein